MKSEDGKVQRLTRFKTRSELLVFSVVCLFVVASSASTYHVSKGGDDSHDGLRRESAFATIQRGGGARLSATLSRPVKQITHIGYSSLDAATEFSHWKGAN